MWKSSKNIKTNAHRRYEKYVFFTFKILISKGKTPPKYVSLGPEGGPSKPPLGSIDFATKEGVYWNQFR